MLNPAAPAERAIHVVRVSSVRDEPHGMTASASALRIERLRRIPTIAPQGRDRFP